MSFLLPSYPCPHAHGYVDAKSVSFHADATLQADALLIGDAKKYMGQTTRTLSRPEVMERLLEKLRRLTRSEDAKDVPRVFVLEDCEVPLTSADARAVLQELLAKVRVPQS